MTKPNRKERFGAKDELYGGFIVGWSENRKLTVWVHTVIILGNEKLDITWR